MIAWQMAESGQILPQTHWSLLEDYTSSAILNVNWTRFVRHNPAHAKNKNGWIPECIIEGKMQKK
jgi:hypothetical protein